MTTLNEDLLHFLVQLAKYFIGMKDVLEQKLMVLYSVQSFYGFRDYLLQWYAYVPELNSRGAQIRGARWQLNLVWRRVICESSEWNLLRVTLLAPRILR
jgi:hypothetical protein